MIAAETPTEKPTLLAIMHARIQYHMLPGLNLDIGELAGSAPDDSRLSSLADRVAVLIEAAAAQAGSDARFPGGVRGAVGVSAAGESRCRREP